MSWTDLGAIRTIRQLRDFFGLETFVETGTFKGINAQVQSRNFKWVYTCEINPRFYREAKSRLRQRKNVVCVNQDSSEFLRQFKGKKLFYLDAHFYNPKGPRWVVKDELKSIPSNDECVIVIHDFDNGLGHCIYDGERLGMDVVQQGLSRINPRFHYYTNRLEDCDILTPEMAADEVMKDNLKYAWSSPRLTYRGLLYAVPRELPNEFKLRKIGDSHSK